VLLDYMWMQFWSLLIGSMILPDVSAIVFMVASSDLKLHFSGSVEVSFLKLPRKFRY
jgi:hypothetical protein